MSAADFDWGVSGDLIAQLRAAEATISRVRALVQEMGSAHTFDQWDDLCIRMREALS